MIATMIARLSLILLISILGPVAIAAQTAVPSNSAASPLDAGRTTLPDDQSDLLAKNALENLAQESGHLEAVKIRVEKGTVIFEGLVSNDKDLEILERAANKLTSVIAVVNRTKAESRDLVDLSPALQEGEKLLDRFKRFIPPVLTAAILVLMLFFLGKLISRFNKKFWSRRIENPFLQGTVSRLTLWPLWLVFFYFILQAAGLSGLATTIIGGTGVLGIVLGLAFKGIAENYLAGLLLATRAPFTRGDLIIVNDQYKGYVQNLNMRGTTIIDLSGHLILIPNSTVINSVVENQSANPTIRTEFIIGISYADSISKAQDILVGAMKTVRGALPDPAPDVVVEEFTSSSVRLRVRVWFNVKETNEPRFRSRTMALAKESLLANGFSIPTDIKELVFSEPLKVHVLGTKEEAATLVQEKRDQVIENAADNLKSGAREQLTTETEATQAKDMLKLASENPLMKDFNGDPKP